MPVEVQGKVGEQVLGPGALADPRLGASGEVVVTELHGKYYEQAVRGRLFHATTPAAGVIIPIFSNVIQQFLIYNPPGSGVNGVINRIIFGYVSGAHVPGHLCIAHSLTAQIAPVTITDAFISSKIGSTGGGKIRVFSPGTVATALTYFRPLFISLDTMVAASTNAPWNFADDLDGTIIVPPGGICAIASNVAQTGNIAVAMVYEEVAVPSL